LVRISSAFFCSAKSLVQAAAVAKKNGFASLAEYDDASMNISMIMSGIDPHRGATPCDNAALRHCASRRWPRRIVSTGSGAYPHPRPQGGGWQEESRRGFFWTTGPESTAS
jgi:hypothetical protein